MTNRTQILKQLFDKSMGLPFKQLLNPKIIEKIFNAQEVPYRTRLYPPIVVIWA